MWSFTATSTPVNALIYQGEVGLIDWTDCGLAPPEADLARFVTALELAAVGANAPPVRIGVRLVQDRLS